MLAVLMWIPMLPSFLESLFIQCHGISFMGDCIYSFSVYSKCQEFEPEKARAIYG